MTLLESDKSVVQTNHHVVLHYMRVNLGIQKMSHVMFLLSLYHIISQYYSEYQLMMGYILVSHN